MPPRIQPNRPYYPRYYLPRGAGQARTAAQPRGGGGGAKGALGGAVDTSPTGNVGGDIVKAIANTIQQNRQNAAANAIMNTQTPPRAGAVGPVVNPATGQVTSNITPTVGTAPQTGGVGELQMRQQQNQADLADALQKAKISAELALAQQRTGRGGGGGGGGGGAGTGNARRWQQYLGDDQTAGKAAGKAGKPPPYKPYSIDAETDSRADEFGHIQADFDDKYGKGMYGKVVPNLSNAKTITQADVDAGTATKDDIGKVVIADAAHPKGPPLLSFSPDEAKYWQNRYNAGNVSVGHPTVGPLPDGTNPNSGQPSGTQVNPVKVENNLQLRALPFGTWIQGPDGTVTQKKALAPQGQKTSQADTGDQGQQVADVTQPQQPASLQDTGLADAIAQRRAVEAQPPPQLAALTPSSTPGSFDLGQLPPTGGLPQDTDLADAIARARAGDQLSAAA